MKNIEAAKKLLEKYKSITLENLKHWLNSYEKN